MLEIFRKKRIQLLRINLYFIYKKKKIRKIKNEKKTVEVSKDVFNQFNETHYFSKKNGNALLMFSVSKELRNITIKRNK